MVGVCRRERDESGAACMELAENITHSMHGIEKRMLIVNCEYGQVVSMKGELLD